MDIPEETAQNLTTPEERIAAALEVIRLYGGFDGGHHKQWVLDQAVRCLTDCPQVEHIGNCGGGPYTYYTRGESDAYREWVREYEHDGEGGAASYEWETGIAP